MLQGGYRVWVGVSHYSMLLLQDPDNPCAELLLGGSGHSCEVNDWDAQQYCRCSPGQRIKKFASIHQDRQEDRKWTLECGAIKPEDVASETKWANGRSDQNDWDGVFHWRGIHRNAFMVGMTSVHDDQCQDRNIPTRNNLRTRLPNTRIFFGPVNFLDVNK